MYVDKNNMVKILEPETNRYNSYDAFFKENNITKYHKNYLKGKNVKLIKDKKYKLVYEGKHYIRNYLLFLIEDEHNNMFLVDKHALYKLSEQGDN